jgi:hypothetical protein
MSEPDRLPTAEEILQRSLERYRRRKAERLQASLPPTPQQRAQTRFGTDNRSDEAVFDHLTREAAEAKRRLDARQLQEEINNHPDVIRLRLQRQGIIVDPIAQAHDRYYRACADILDANAEIAAHSDAGFHRGPGED